MEHGGPAHSGKSSVCQCPEDQERWFSLFALLVFGLAARLPCLHAEDLQNVLCSLC